MRISVFGLGYVGLVTAVCHAADGHQVVGVDKDLAKIKDLERGVSPISEPAIDGLLRCGLSEGRLSLTSDIRAAVKSTDLALICVGTPSAQDGGTDLSAVVTVSREIGAALRETQTSYTVVLRSTVPPGATRDLVGRALVKSSGTHLGPRLRLYFNPEFLRQGSAVNDFRNPPFVVCGTAEGLSTLPDSKAAQLLFSATTETQIVLNFQEAELLKLACNAYHALKIDFANEIGTLAQSVGADPFRVMDAFVRDEKLNISAAYLRPGFAFGGSCLPKDVRSLNHIARSHQLELPISAAILPSNDAHLMRLAAKLVALYSGTIGIVGLTFKPNTDDLRESPSIRLLGELRRKHADVVVYEPEVRIDALRGRNLESLRVQLPDYLDRIVHDWGTLCERADTLVITRDGVVRSDELRRFRGAVVDLGG